MDGTEATRTTTLGGAHERLWIGAEEPGPELEIIDDETEPDDVPHLLVIHVMPTRLRGQ